MTSEPINRKLNRGFTLVELIIAIIVIAILATIILVAFNGIQDKARRSALTTEVGNVVQQLREDQIIDDVYPTTLAQSNDGKGVTLTSDTKLRYSVNNSTSPPSFCITATGGRFSYMSNQTGVISEGGCVNVALGATSPSALVTDGSTVTSPWYSSGSGLQSTTVTLAQIYDITSVKVWHYYGDGRTYNATKTEVSADGTNWHTVFDSAVSGTYQETAAGKTHNFDLRPVRYIRDWINGSTSNISNHWVEIQAY